MIVCVCHAVSDDALDRMIEDGVDTPERIGETCGAGTDCGSCLSMLQFFIDEAGAGVASASDHCGRLRCVATSRC